MYVCTSLNLLFTRKWILKCISWLVTQNVNGYCFHENFLPFAWKSESCTLIDKRMHCAISLINIAWDFIIVDKSASRESYSQIAQNSSFVWFSFYANFSSWNCQQVFSSFHLVRPLFFSSRKRCYYKYE